MARHAGGWVRSWAVGLCGVAGLWACGANRGSGADDTDVERAPSTEGQRDVSGADGIRYQIVETSDGVSMEAVTSTSVQTFSCPNTCSGICDECAARACAAVGELSDVCASLVRDCQASCRCGQASPAAPGSCGFPVCATNRNLCYIAADDGPQEPPLPEPEPDPAPSSLSPSSGASRPGSSSAPNGAGAATPAPAG